ncbi:B-cell receptor CD22-like [Solea senegalensis]|uniref:B-cell receptor CD22-like n=2 Tax=Solea senegalensis TaxID=28829 RepID=A0AAV6QCT0_SOLSE|nr:B-cell receptor CD22-like [Solea senegalensis]
MDGDPVRVFATVNIFDAKLKTTLAMLLAEAGCVFMGFILYSSGLPLKSRCVLKGSTVDLPCSAERASVAYKWFTKQDYHWSEISVDRNHQRYNLSNEIHPTLTIKDLRESDNNYYCCSYHGGCLGIEIQLHVADLQVKVVPSAEEHMMSLVCSTSCVLTERPAVYVWYRNGETVYEDRSPWYQELVSSEKAVTYSCAVKGYEHLRAPEVSVDSVTSACFTVTYATGSITYPKKVRVQAEPTWIGHYMLTCNSSCSLMDQQTAFSRYENGVSEQKISLVTPTSTKIFYCAVKSNEFLLSDEFCLDENYCGRVHYASRRICALKGSSVTIPSEYLSPGEQNTGYWLRSDTRNLKLSHRIKSHSNKTHHNLKINTLKKNDSAKYVFIADNKRRNWVNPPGVTLFVTDVSVQFAPSAEVTEGQRVTVTCRTSCPLANDTNYIWYFNNQTLDGTKRHSKHLVLDPVSSQHAGNYVCAVKTQKHRSDEGVLTVHRKTWIPAVTRVVVVLLVLIIPTVVFVWRKKTTCRKSPGAKTSDNVEQISLGHEYEGV